MGSGAPSTAGSFAAADRKMKGYETTVWGFILGWAFLMVLLAFFIQARDYYGMNPIVRQRLAVKEAFQAGAGAGPPLTEPKDVGEEAGGGLQPAAAALAEPRTPYTLLNGWLSPIEKGDAPSPASSFTAERCHDSDFQTRLERTGNYRQLTNNYKRESPDSCSAPLQDTALGFYKIDPLGSSGCLSNKEWKLQAGQGSSGGL